MDASGNISEAETQTVSGGCYTLQYSHNHINACYPVVSCHELGSQKDSGRWYVHGECSNGHKVTIVVDAEKGSTAARIGGIGYCTSCPVICNKNEGTYYKLNCGKDNTSIDSIIITF